jgi:hypothetical protein
VHNGDLVPNIPPQTFQLSLLSPRLTFQHTTPYFFLNNPTFTPPTPADLLVISSPDLDIATKSTADGVAAHGWYFNAITFCDTLPANVQTLFSMDDPDFKKKVEGIEQILVSNNIMNSKTGGGI